MRMLHTVHLQRFHSEGDGDEGEEGSGASVTSEASVVSVAPTVAGLAEAGGGLSLEDVANLSYGGNWTGAGGPGGRAPASVFESNLIIPLYVIIFVLAIVGNSLVLATLAQNKRMRTVTNVYLLNLVKGSHRDQFCGL